MRTPLPIFVLEYLGERRGMAPYNEILCEARRIGYWLAEWRLRRTIRGLRRRGRVVEFAEKGRSYIVLAVFKDASFRSIFEPA